MSVTGDALFIRLWNEGVAAAKIAEVFGISLKHVPRLRDRLKCKPRKSFEKSPHNIGKKDRKKVTPEQLAEMRRSMTLDAMAAEVNISRSRIQDILKEYRSSVPKKPPTNKPSDGQIKRDHLGKEPLAANIPYTLAILEQAKYINLD